MKKISLVLAALLLAGSATGYAFDENGYTEMRNEIAALIDECRSLGLNCDYWEKSLNIFDYNTSFIKNDIKNGVPESLTEYKENCINEIYKSAKAALEEMKETKESVGTIAHYGTGDFNISGRKLLNSDGKPIFSVGVLNSNPSNSVSEIRNIGFENVQIEWGPKYVLSENHAVDCWIPNTENTKYRGAVQEEGRLHIFNDGTGNISIYQTVLTKPNTEYIINLNAAGNLSGVTVSAGELGKIIETGNNTAAFVADDYVTDIYIGTDKISDAYIDDITVTAKGDDGNIIINGDFSGDGHESFDICFDKNKARAVLKTLDRAEEKNLSVNMLLSPHYFPDFLKDDIKYGPLGFYDYIIDSDIAEEALKAYIYAIMPYAAEYRSLTSVCLSNEPQYNTALAEEVYRERFVKYLKEVHGDNVGEFYADVENVEMPQSVESTVLFYDWMNFNNKVFADWHSRLAKWVKDKAPEMPVHIKAMNEIGPLRTYMQSGIDMELFDEFCDILGNDSGAYLERDVKTSFVRQLMWYDYLGSISDKPIYNSEEHITLDASTDLDEQMPDHFRSVLWQGAIHGRNISTIWLWNAAAEGALSGHIKMRPDCTEAAVHTSLDLSRLAEEVYAFGDKAPDAAILYSKASLVYSDEYMEDLYNYYASLIFAGKTVRFVTDAHPENMHCADILLIPNAKNVKEKTLGEIKRFADEGKKIIMIGENSLKYDEYNRAHDSSEVSYIKGKSEFFHKYTLLNKDYPKVETITEEAAKDNEYTLVDSKGKLMSNLEYRIAVSDGRVLMNVYYIDDEYRDSKVFYIKKGDEYIQGSVDLISGKKQGKEITISSREPMLLEIGESKAADVINLDAKESNGKTTLSWEYSSENEKRACIYTVGDGGELSLKAKVCGNSYTAETEGTVTYTVKALNGVGAMSVGKSVTAGLEPGFTLINSEKTTADEITGACRVYLENPSAHPVAARISVTARDRDTNEIKKMAAYERILPPKEKDEFGCNVFEENTIIEITEN